MSENFPKPKSLRANVEVKLNLSDYATKADLKNAKGVDASDLANLKSGADQLHIDILETVPSNLGNFKKKVDKLDVKKLVPVPVDLSKLSDVGKNYVAKINVSNAKIKDIEDKVPNITNLTTNTTFNSKINEIKNEILSVNNLATTPTLNAKINKVKNKIPKITNLATTTALNAVENKIPHYSKYITTPEFNKLTAENFSARLAKANYQAKLILLIL